MNRFPVMKTPIGLERISYNFVISYIWNHISKNINFFQLYKNVFCPDLGHTLAFIGFVEPASGGRVPMSEMQSRWFAELTQGNISLPGQNVMNRIIDKEVVSIFIYIMLLIVCTQLESEMFRQHLRRDINGHQNVSERFLVRQCRTAWETSVSWNSLQNYMEKNKLKVNAWNLCCIYIYFLYFNNIYFALTSHWVWLSITSNYW